MYHVEDQKNGENLRGGLSEDASCTISGITIGETYNFKIEECLEMDISTGKEKSIFFLLEYENREAI